MKIRFAIILCFLIVFYGHTQVSFISKSDTSSSGIPVGNPALFFRIKPSGKSYSESVSQLRKNIQPKDFQPNCHNFWASVNLCLLPFLKPVSIYEYSPVNTPFRGMSAGDYSQIYSQTHVKDSNIPLKIPIGVP